MLDSIEIVFQDEELVIINKPHGLLVHRSAIAKDATTSVLKILRKQLNAKLFTIHRLDRKTSGVMILGLNPNVQSFISQEFKERNVTKVYHAIVRGYIDETGTIDYAIKNDKGVIKDAITKYQCLQRFEIDLPFGKHNTSRYSLVELKPTTGRYHQLRMHLAHIFHPIIGDRPHGCNKQNKLFKEKFGLTKMLLHASTIQFKRSESVNEEKHSASYSAEFSRILEILQNKKRDIVLEDLKGQ